MIDSNDPAFPRTNSDGGSLDEQDGMSLRTYIAAKAMAGLLADYAGDGIGLPSWEQAAKQAVGYADALITELNKGETP